MATLAPGLGGAWQERVAEAPWVTHAPAFAVLRAEGPPGLRGGDVPTSPLLQLAAAPLRPPSADFTGVAVPWAGVAPE